jgi:hypothetical protein
VAGFLFTIAQRGTNGNNLLTFTPVAAIIRDAEERRSRPRGELHPDDLERWRRLMALDHTVKYRGYIRVA